MRTKIQADQVSLVPTDFNVAARRLSPQLAKELTHGKDSAHFDSGASEKYSCEQKAKQHTQLTNAQICCDRDLTRTMTLNNYELDLLAIEAQEFHGHPRPQSQPRTQNVFVR